METAIYMAFIAIAYGAIFYTFFLRIRAGVLKKRNPPFKNILMWFSEICFTVILPIIGFLMLKDSGAGLGSLNEVNNEALFKISSQQFNVLSTLGIGLCVFYFVLRIWSENETHLNLINNLLVMPLLFCLLVAIWLGKSLAFGFIPIFITLPVLSPLISIFYILVLIKQNKNDYQPSTTLDEHLFDN